MHKKCAFSRNPQPCPGASQSCAPVDTKGLTIGWKLAEVDAELATEGRSPGAAGHDKWLLSRSPRRSIGRPSSRCRARRAILMHAASEFRATEGAVGEGSAVRSDGEKTPLFQRRPLALAVRLPAHCRACRSSRRGRFRKVAPACPAIERPQRQNPVSSPVFGRKSLPQIEAIGGDRKFARVAVLLAAPHPIPARLLGTTRPLNV
ncbi:hypothetical protein GGD56_003387 [Rhizobium mongolense]|uniref:Uncharacterized protein n=1 Tax=Rhizobium mongolense TaxID=57676 RepID=A0ABR6INS5_9HYPH|nr:hypothetical protein [Rhizobium mongolense]